MNPIHPNDWQLAGSGGMTDAQRRLLNAACAQLAYNPDTGSFEWMVKGRGRFKRIGNPAGSIGHHGYVRICVCGIEKYAHQWAVAIHYGEFISKPFEIDHINGDTSDNRISNLRIATVAENRQNTRGKSCRRSAFKGARFDARYGTWSASIAAFGSSYHLGTFSSEEGACAAYRSAALRLHGEFAKW